MSRFDFISFQSLFCERVKPTVQHGELFYPNLHLCVSIPRLLIAAWPLTLTANNRIACCGHRPWSRSYKCTAHVCMNSSINASLASMFDRVISVRALSRFFRSPSNSPETHRFEEQSILYSTATGFFFTQSAHTHVLKKIYILFGCLEHIL